MATETFGINLNNTDTNSVAGSGTLELNVSPLEVSGSIDVTLGEIPVKESLEGKLAVENPRVQVIELVGTDVKLRLLRNSYFDNGTYAGSAEWRGGQGVYNVSTGKDS